MNLLDRLISRPRRSQKFEPQLAASDPFSKISNASARVKDHSASRAGLSPSNSGSCSGLFDANDGSRCEPWDRVWVHYVRVLGPPSSRTDRDRTKARTALRSLDARVIGRSVAAGVFAAIALWSAHARAAPFDLRGDDWEGLSQLVRMAESELGDARVVATSTLDWHGLGPADALLIVHPTRSLDVEELSSFMRAGGRVILLDDYGTGEDLLARFGVRRRPLPARPAEMLRGNPALAIAEPAAEHPVVRDVSRVVTNHATGLEHPALSPVLVVRGDGEPDVLLAVAGTVGKGRMLAIGDASIPMNSMLRYPGNRALALALVRYATEDDSWGKRGGRLYMLANGFETKGTFGDDSPMANAASEVHRAMTGALDALERDGMPPLAMYLVAVALGIGVIVWTGAHAGRTHKLAMPRFVRPVPVVAQGGIAGHAAVLGAPRTSRALAVLELKSALEEDIATRLGMDRALVPEHLLERVRTARLLTGDAELALARLFETMAGVETKLAKRAGAPVHLRDAEVLAMAAEVRNLRRLLGLLPIAEAAGRDILTART